MAGSIPELDMVLTGDEGWYPCAEETNALVFDAKSKSNGTFYFKSSKLTNQTYQLRMPVGTSVTLNGTVYNGNGNTDVIATTVGKTVKFTESINGALTYFAGNSNNLTGSIPDLSNNIALTHFFCQSNQLIGSIPSLSTNTLLQVLSCHNNYLTGSIPSLSEHRYLTYFYCHFNQLTGLIPNFSTNAQLAYFYCYGNQLTGYEGGNIKVTASFNASNNKLTVAAVDSILQGLVDGGTTGSAIIVLNGGTNGVPTNTAAIDTLRGRGCTVTVNT